MARARRSMKADAVVACDLFAGAGGFSLGAYYAKISVAAAVEWDRHAAETYRRNLIDDRPFAARLYEEDITQLDPKRVREEAFGEQACDLLLGGPPCQGFSTHRIKDAGVDDPRNGLLLRYFEYVRVLRPMFFLVENVPGLLWPRHEKYLAKFYSLADKAGYEVLEPAVINARDFGVPQNRKRVFLLGYDRSRAAAPGNWPPTPTHASPGAATDLCDWVPAAVAFSEKAPKGDPNDIHMNHGRELVEAFRRTPPNGGSRRDSGRTLPCHKDHDGHKDVYGRIDPRLPGPTMTTACINPSKGRFVHPTQHHGITLRQAARLQSFPDWFIFSGGLMSGGVQVGNAVPVDLATALLVPLRHAVIAVKRSERRSAA